MTDYLISLLTSDDTSQDIYPELMLTRMICSCISLVFCLGIIIIYIVLCFQVHSQKIKGSKGKDDIEKTNITSNSNKSIGLGSHFMLFLILSNFISSIIPIIYYALYQKGYFKKEDKVTTGCTILGFSHNFFDLCAVCWTSVIVKLFLTSTRINEFVPGEERKTMLFSFLYSFICPFLFTIIPFSTSEPYGNAGTHCSFYYPENDKQKEDHPIKWNYLFSAFVFVNLLYNLYCLILVIKYYSKKLKNYVKDSHDYKVIKRYVNVFRVFPLVLILSRSAKGLSRGMTETLQIKNPIAIAIIGYLSSILYCLNGFANSLICVYFFRGVFTCWKNKEQRKNTTEEIKTIEEVEGQNSLLVPKTEETDEEKEEDENKESSIED